MIVIDTSIAFKWFSESEIDHKKALKILEVHLSGKNPVFVPDLFLYELTNAWSTKTNLTFKDIANNLRLLEKLRLNLFPVDYKLCLFSSKMAKKYGISVYDAVYLVLARQKNCPLITADEKFKKKVNLSMIKTI